MPKTKIVCITPLRDSSSPPGPPDLAERGLAGAGDMLVVLAAMPAAGHANFLKVEELGAATP